MLRKTVRLSLRDNNIIKFESLYPLLTVDEKDIPDRDQRQSLFTQTLTHSYYTVMYYDIKFKTKCLFTIKIKTGENILSSMRTMMALHHLELKHPQLKAPELNNIKEINSYILIVKNFFNIKEHIDIEYIAEKYVKPKFFDEIYKFDFYEASRCKGCREGELGIKVHSGPDGCF